MSSSSAPAEAAPVENEKPTASSLLERVNAIDDDAFLGGSMEVETTHGAADSASSTVKANNASSVVTTDSASSVVKVDVNDPGSVVCRA